MGTIKDLYDLIEKLRNSMDDRKALELVLPLRDKIFQLEREQLEFEKTEFDARKKLTDEIADLKSSHEKEVAELNERHSKKMHDLKFKFADHASELVGETQRVEVKNRELREELCDLKNKIRFGS